MLPGSGHLAVSLALVFVVVLTLVRQVHSSCGQTSYTSTVGLLKSPNFPSLYPNRINCRWTISTSVGQVLIIKFTNFDFYSSGCYDYIMIYNGGKQSKHCSNNSPGTIRSQGNNVVIHMVTDGSSQRSGFRMTWSSEISCGQLSYHNDTGTLVSPGFPHNNLNNINCSWTIATVRGQVLKINFDSISLKEDQKCRHEYVTIVDGGNRHTFCGKEIPGKYTSQSNSVVIKFQVDNNDPGGSFKLSWSSETPCGEIYLGLPSGTLKSQGNLGRYFNDINCNWTVVTDSDKILNVRFTELFLEYEKSCSYDNVTIVESNHQRTFCGSEIPGNFYSQNNSMLVFFRTDRSVVDKGFTLEWSSTWPCNSSIDADSGTLTSLGYPQTYFADMNCNWTITVRVGNVLHISFADFSLEHDEKCARDNLTVFDGTNTVTLCGDITPSPILTQGNSVKLHFQTDGFNTQRGFKIDWFAKPSCGETSLFQSSGTLASPGYPGRYFHDLRCQWTISTSRDQVLSIRFTEFSLEEEEVCIYDNLTISDGKIQKTFCGNEVPTTFISVKNSIVIEFVTDHYINGKGFRLEWSSTWPCGASVIAQSGLLTSPGYPESYFNDANCQWNISTVEGKALNINFTAFALESHEKCAMDSVQVINNNKQWKFCGKSIPDSFLAETQSVSVRFRTNSAIRDTGFALAWTSVNFCGNSILTSPSGILTTPGFPRKYYNNFHCNWTITVSKSRVMNVRFTDFSVEDSANCSRDSLTIYDGGNRKTYCGNQLPNAFLSKSNSIIVEFQTDHNIRKGGYRLEWSSAWPCGALINSDTGSLASPGYPDGYFNNINCNWTISSKVGKVLNFTFVDFALGNGRKCTLDNLIIFDGNRQRKFCGTNSPPNYISRSKSVVIRFQTNKDITDKGFLLLWSAAPSCGDTIYNLPSGGLASPGYPGKYFNDMTCTWTIHVPIGQMLILNFTKFLLEPNKDCGFDSFTVVDGSYKERFCGNSSPGIYTSRSNSVRLLFDTDASRTYDGFRLTWSSKENPCGNTVYNSPNGSLKSPGFPDNYKDKTDCEWRISTEIGQVLNLHFTNFSLRSEGAKDGSCRNDTLTIIEGDKQENVFCGDQIPNELISQSNTITLQLHTDEVLTSLGFQVAWTSQDLNECNSSTNEHRCHFNAFCTNTMGSYQCSCNLGFSGDGFSCHDVDECANDTIVQTCHTEAVCVNTVGSYTCVCNSGFTGNGTTCADIDECQSDANNCHANATCLNIPGKFGCLCNAGFNGNGVTCAEEK
ncbi:cubilin-like [Clavelina lepadiformis]|uniref:Cubilin n=1 Tax=Clavelina lepadiformis TaxID=159417 RepID=A0ABP0FRL0_CLALP